MVSPSLPGRKVALSSATCVDTCAASYVDMANKSAGSVAAMAEDRKKMYKALAAFHCFVPIAIETSGVFGPQTKCFLTSLSSQI